MFMNCSHIRVQESRRNLRMSQGSLYLTAGSPTRCQNDACKKPFEGYCIRGDNDRYYCCEVCAQIGMEIDFDQIASRSTPRIVA